MIDGQPLPRELSAPAVSAATQAQAFDLEAQIETGSAARIDLQLHGVQVVYDVTARALRCGPVSAPLALADGRLSLRLLLDSGSLEIFAGDGATPNRVALSVAGAPPLDDCGVSLRATGGNARLHTLTLHGLRGIWPTA